MQGITHAYFSNLERKGSILSPVALIGSAGFNDLNLFIGNREEIFKPVTSLVGLGGCRLHFAEFEPVWGFHPLNFTFLNL